MPLNCPEIPVVGGWSRPGRSDVHPAGASEAFTACLTRNLIAYGTGDDALEAYDCQVSEAVAQLPAAPTMADLVRVATASPALLYREEEAAP